MHTSAEDNKIDLIDTWIPLSATQVYRGGGKKIVAAKIPGENGCSHGHSPGDQAGAYAVHSQWIPLCILLGLPLCRPKVMPYSLLIHLAPVPFIAQLVP